MSSGLSVSSPFIWKIFSLFVVAYHNSVLCASVKYNGFSLTLLYACSHTKRKSNIWFRCSTWAGFHVSMEIHNKSYLHDLQSMSKLMFTCNIQWKVDNSSVKGRARSAFSFSVRLNAARVHRACRYCRSVIVGVWLVLCSRHRLLTSHCVTVPQTSLDLSARTLSIISSSSSTSWPGLLSSLSLQC